jgi:hypothetical protein
VKITVSVEGAVETSRINKPSTCLLLPGLILGRGVILLFVAAVNTVAGVHPASSPAVTDDFPRVRRPEPEAVH